MMQGFVDEKTIFNELVVALRKQIKFIKNNGYPGLVKYVSNPIIDPEKNSKFWIDIEQESQSDLEILPGNEEVTFTLPYAGTKFSFIVKFNFFEPWKSPVLFFMNVKFMDFADMENLKTYVPCLQDWKCLKEDMLYTLFKQLLNLYQHYNVLETAFRGDDVNQEFFDICNAVISLKNIKREDMEVCVHPKRKRVYFTMMVPVSLPSDARMALSFAYSDESVISKPKCYFVSSGVDYVDVKIEKLLVDMLIPTHCDKTALEYVNAVIEAAFSFVQNFRERKLFFAELCGDFKRYLAWLDYNSYTKAAFRFEDQDSENKHEIIVKYDDSGKVTVKMRNSKDINLIKVETFDINTPALIVHVESLMLDFLGPPVSGALISS